MQAVASMQAGAFHLGGDESTEGVDPAIECYPAGQGVGGISAVEPAGDVVRAIVAEAQEALARLGTVLTPA
jgi:enoyl-[acyl-carrier protein] reductase II